MASPYDIVFAVNQITAATALMTTNGAANEAKIKAYQCHHTWCFSMAIQNLCTFYLCMGCTQKIQAQIYGERNKHSLHKIIQYAR